MATPLITAKASTLIFIKLLDTRAVLLGGFNIADTLTGAFIEDIISRAGIETTRAVADRNIPSEGVLTGNATRCSWTFTTKVINFEY